MWEKLLPKRISEDRDNELIPATEVAIKRFSLRITVKEFILVTLYAAFACNFTDSN